MRIFLTGATGFIGSALVPELLAAGHQVLGLSRSEDGAQALRAAGAEPHRGDIEDLDSLRRGASGADAVIHTAFNHSFRDAADFARSCEQDRQVIAALGEALGGPGRPLLITSGTAMGTTTPGQPASEDHFDAAHRNPRVASEQAGQALLEQGVDVRVLRLSQIHDARKQGLVTMMVELAREKGVSAYVGEGRNTWSAAHLSDTARLYRLALERGETGRRYNATAESAVPSRAIAEAVGRAVGVPAVSLTPEQAPEHFGWLALFASHDMSASNVLTRERLGWEPTGPGLVADLDAMGEAMRRATA